MQRQEPRADALPGTTCRPTGYDGPCPPPDGQVHHYVFTVSALPAAHIKGVHITYERPLPEIAPDLAGATSIIGKFRLPLHR